MNVTTDCWQSLRAPSLQRVLRSAAIQSLHFRGVLLLCLIVTCAYRFGNADTQLQARKPHTDEQRDGTAQDTGSQRLRGYEQAQDLHVGQYEWIEADATAVLPRVLKEGDPVASPARLASTGPNSNRDNGNSKGVPPPIGPPIYGGSSDGSSGDGNAPPAGSGGGNSSAGRDGEGSGQSSHPPPLQRQHQHPSGMVCEWDRVQAPDSSGSCGPRLVAMAFAAAGPGSSSGGGGASSALMCAEPAAFSSETGTLTMSLCWRPGDPPDTLLAAAAPSAATAAAAATLRITLPRLRRYGISAMAPGNYSLAVDGGDSFGAVVHPAASVAGDVSFGPFSPDTAASRAPVLTVPAGGASELTLWFEVKQCASGFGADSTAAAGQSGQSGSNKADRDTAVGVTASRRVSITLVGSPNPPAAATTCKCALTAASTAGCPPGLVPLAATTTTTNTAAAPFVQCIPPPLYDKVSRRFAFSTCWRYACLPASFARQPYELLLGPLSSVAVASPPGGTYRLRVAAPAAVALSYEWTAASGGGPWSAAAGTTGDSQVTVPYGGLGQMQIRIRVPFDLDVDGAAGSLDLKLLRLATGATNNGSSTGTGGSSGGGSGGGSGGLVLETPDGSAAAMPALPSEAAAANATLVVVSQLWIPRRIGGGGGGQSTVSELEELVRRGMAAGAPAQEGAAPDNVSVSIQLVGFRLVIPLEFPDFAAVGDCGADSLAALRADAAAALAVVDPASYSATAASAATLLSVGCAYGAFSASDARRRLRGLLQQTCTARLNSPVSVDMPPTDLDAYLSSATSSLSSTYGGSICALDPSSPDIQVVTKLALSVVMPASRAGSSTGGDAAAAATACTAGAQALASSLGLIDGEARLVGCQLTASVPEASTAQQNGLVATATDSGDDGGGGVSTAIIAAAVGGGVAIMLVAVVAAAVVLRRRRRRRSQFLSAEPFADRKTGDSRTTSLSGAVRCVHADSADSIGLALAGAAAGVKRQRRSSNGGGGGGGGGGGALEAGVVAATSSKSIASYNKRRFSSNFKGSSPPPSGYGSDSMTGCGGMEAGFLSVVPSPAAVSAPGEGPSAPRHASGGGDATSPSYWAESPPARYSRGSPPAVVQWGRVTHPGCAPLELPKGAGGGGDVYGPEDDGSRGCPTRCSRGSAGSRFSGGGTDAWHDYFGFEDAVDGTVIAAGELGQSPGSSGGRLAARRSRDGGGGGRRCGSFALHRSNGGNLLMQPPPLTNDGDGGRGAAGAPPTPGRSTLAQAPAALGALRALQLAFALPGAEACTGDGDLLYGGDPIVAAAVAVGIDDGVEGDLLRVQSRRPAFLDRTRGSLAAVVAGTAAMPRGGGGGGIATGAAGCSGDPAPSVEPRREGFSRRISVAPYIGGPPSYMPYIRGRNVAGSATAAGGGGGGGYAAACSAPPTVANSPGAG